MGVGAGGLAVKGIPPINAPKPRPNAGLAMAGECNTGMGLSILSLHLPHNHNRNPETGCYALIELRIIKSTTAVKLYAKIYRGLQSLRPERQRGGHGRRRHHRRRIWKNRHFSRKRHSHAADWADSGQG
jgi:hypothetical protein